MFNTWNSCIHFMYIDFFCRNKIAPRTLFNFDSKINADIIITKVKCPKNPGYNIQNGNFDGTKYCTFLQTLSIMVG